MQPYCEKVGRVTLMINPYTPSRSRDSLVGESYISLLHSVETRAVHSAQPPVLIDTGGSFLGGKAAG
jgi:hypothetical protein